MNQVASEVDNDKNEGEWIVFINEFKAFHFELKLYGQQQKNQDIYDDCLPVILVVPLKLVRVEALRFKGLRIESIDRSILF